MAPISPDVLGRLSADMAPFCAVDGLRFGLGDAPGDAALDAAAEAAASAAASGGESCGEQEAAAPGSGGSSAAAVVDAAAAAEAGEEEAAGGAGPWRNFFVGLVGGVAPHEDDILWPNQVGGRMGALPAV